jgi:D-inositol-3-phosphate glycosyltransferase
MGNLGTKDTGGMSVYVREMAQELGKQGILVDIYTRIHDTRDEQILELGQNTRLIHLRAGEDEDINKLAIYCYLPNFACNVENFRKQDDIQYDLVFSHYWLSGWVGEFLQRWWNIPHATMFHTLGAVKNAIGIGEDEPELRIETERHLARNCHHIIATTEQEKEDLILHYDAPPNRISVIPCGVNLELFKPIDKKLAKQQLGFKNDNIILFVGRIEPLKGIDQLIRAMTYLPNIQGLKLLIIGGDENSQHEMERLKKLSRTLHIEGSVTFLGTINQHELYYYYSAADVCVLPSYYESFGLVALEAIACGTPVVATNVGNLNKIIQPANTGYVVTKNNPQQIAEKIALLLSKPDSSITNILSIRESVNQFGWPNIAQQTIQQLHKVTSGYITLVH